MKLLKYLTLAFLLPLPTLAQLSTSGGTLTVNGPIGGGDYKQRDEVRLEPGTDLTPTSAQEGHVFIDPSILINTSYSSNGANGSSTTISIDKSLSVGSIPGGGRIDLNGCAHYSMPIKLPPGTNGIVPSLSIEYNSFTGNGILGKGWNISGLSSISRVEQDYYHDQNCNSIQLDDGVDKYSLDGNRMIPIAGTNSFNLENEDFSTLIVGITL